MVFMNGVWLIEGSGRRLSRKANIHAIGILKWWKSRRPGGFHVYGLKNVWCIITPYGHKRYAEVWMWAMFCVLQLWFK